MEQTERDAAQAGGPKEAKDMAQSFYDAVQGQLSRNLTTEITESWNNHKRDREQTD